MGIIQIGQGEDMYGENESTLKFLDMFSEEHPQIKSHLSNLNKTIEFLNSLGIEIDISIRYDTIIFKK